MVIKGNNFLLNTQINYLKKIYFVSSSYQSIGIKYYCKNTYNTHRFIKNT